MPVPPLPLLNFFVTLVMVSIGLRVSGGELVRVLNDRALFTRMLVVNCLLVPLIGFLLVKIFPLTPDSAVGILLLAAIPGTPISLQFTRLAKTRLAFTAVVTFVLCLTSIAITPLTLEVLPTALQRSQRPIADLAESVLLYFALPLSAGLCLSRRWPNFAARLVLPLEILATAVFLFLMWETRLARREALFAIAGGGAILAMFLLLAASMTIGWLIGGPDAESRRILATSTSMRSVIVVLYVARYCFPGTKVYMVPVVYLTLMVPINLLFHLTFEVRRRWHARAVHA